jgi:hypothetical protein
MNIVQLEATQISSVQYICSSSSSSSSSSSNTKMAVVRIYVIMKLGVIIFEKYTNFIQATLLQSFSKRL